MDGDVCPVMVSAPGNRLGRLWRRECEGEPQYRWYHWAPGGHFPFLDEPSALTEVLLPLVRDGDRSAAFSRAPHRIDLNHLRGV